MACCSTLNRLKIINISAACLQVIVFIILIDCEINIHITGYGSETYIINIIAFFFLIVLYAINILVACWFIYSVTSNDPKCVTYYALILLINIVFLLLRLDYNFFIVAMFEFCVLYCAAMLRKECKKLIPNDPETPPPTYNSCSNDTKIPSAEPSAFQSNEQHNADASLEIVPDPQVDPSTSSNGSNGSH